MSLIRALTHRDHVEERSIMPGWQWGQLLAGEYGPTSAASVTRALQNAAVSACVGLITDAIARTPVDAVRYSGPNRVPVTPVPSVIADPNPTMVTATAWRRQLGFSVGTHGNAVGVVLDEDRFGFPTVIQLVDPYTASLEIKNGLKWIRIGDKYDRVWQDGGRYWHATGRQMSPGSPYGRSWITEARNTIGLGLAAEDFSNQFFSDGGHPTWGLASETDLSPEQAKGLKAAFLDAFKPGRREPVVYGKGIEPKQFSVQPGETQFIDTMRFVSEQVARFAGVPAPAIGAAMSGQSVTYASVSDVDLRTLKDTYIGYFTELEAALSACLPKPQMVKFNQDAILRGDPKLRTEIISAQITAGLLSVNEGRRLLDLAPWPDEKYDEPFATSVDPAGVMPPEPQKVEDVAPS